MVGDLFHSALPVADHHVRMGLVQLHQQPGQYMAAVGGDVELLLALFFLLLAQQIHVFQNGFRIRIGAFSKSRQPQALGGAFKQRLSEIRFQLMDHFADIGLGGVELSGGLSQTSITAHRHKVFQLLEFHCIISACKQACA